MKWYALRRETGLVEGICEHGVGHPLPGSVEWMDAHAHPGAKGTWGVHGCDGCCGREDAPKLGDPELEWLPRKAS